MSSISSSLNSVSTAFCNDFYKHFRSGVADEKLLKIARIATILTGIIGVLLALWMAGSNIKSLWTNFTDTWAVYRRPGGNVPFGYANQKGKCQRNPIGFTGKCVADLVHKCLYRDQFFDVRLFRGSVLFCFRILIQLDF
ncbi:hypothetical protein Q2T40_00225 [Winogradskyella maritima]|nr:hypothetical protein [Winogradskyella maritima]